MIAKPILPSLRFFSFFAFHTKAMFIDHNFLCSRRAVETQNSTRTAIKSFVATKNKLFSLIFLYLTRSAAQALSWQMFSIEEQPRHSVDSQADLFMPAI